MCIIDRYCAVPEYSFGELRDFRTCYRQREGNDRVGKLSATGAAAGREVFGGSETLSESGIQNNRYGPGSRFQQEDVYKRQWYNNLSAPDYIVWQQVSAL